MTRNDADDFTQRLYARIPENYRVYDEEQGRPLLALVQVIAEQVANLRQNLDELWDDFFIETCQDWIVPYIGALVGTNLLANPVGRSNRLEVRDTVLWRRSKGTVAMLASLGNEISGWPSDTAEFLHSLGWSQNMNHLRMGRSLTADLSDPYQLSLLGRAADPFAHAADTSESHDLDQARVTRRLSAMGSTGWGTPGRYQIKNVGFFVRRLMAFPIHGAIPAAVDPGSATAPNASYFTFDPLHREIPLFTSASAAPITRAMFGHAPGQFFGSDVTVRQFGIPLAVTAPPQPDASSTATPFSFGNRTGSLALDSRVGIRLLDASTLRSGSAHFVLTAQWSRTAGGPVALGSISTLLASLDDPQAFRAAPATSGAGHLVIAITAGRPGLGFSIPASPAARFPGAVIAVRASRSGAPHVDDARYIYLPPAFVPGTGTLTYHVADDGSTFTDSRFTPASLARASEGQIYPPLLREASATPASDLQLISRMPGAMRIADPARIAGVGLLIQAELFTGVFQPQGAIATVNQPAASYTYLDTPADPWPAFAFAPAHSAPPNNVPTALLTILVRPLSGTFIPSFEVIVQGRGEEALLVYVPEVAQAPTTGVRFFVAVDGSTWSVPVNPTQGGLLDTGDLARAASWQSLPIAGNWPLQYRRPVAIDLCRSERASLLRRDELGVDPELGRFALSPGDPAIPGGALSVDYVEAFADRVGASTYDRMLDPQQPATRFVSQSGEVESPVTASPPAALPVHRTLAAAVAAAVNGDVIEIVDSATYPATSNIVLGNAQVKSLTIRAAAGQRPCLTFFRAPATPTNSLHVTAAMDFLELNGLLVSGGPMLLDREVSSLRLEACTLDPRFGPSLLTTDNNLNGKAQYLLCRCIAGGLRVGNGVAQLTIADSVVDQSRSFAVAGLPGASSPPAPSSPPPSLLPSARSVQLERVTVLGRIHCDVLVASESILDDLAIVEDQQSGCIRFSRYETGSQLPRRFQCIPSETDAAACATGPGRCLAPVFNSRRFGRPAYAQLAGATPTQILTGSEGHSEIGAFAGAESTVRLANLLAKLTEFMPIGLEPVIIAET